MMVRVVAGRLTLAAASLLAIAGCQRNHVREVDLKSIDARGSYVLFGVETAVASGTAPPPGAENPPSPNPPRSNPRSLQFEREGNDQCWSGHRLVMDFPAPGTGIRYRAFEVPPGRYVSKETLRAGDDWRTHVPAFEVRADQIVYLGNFVLGPDGDIEVELEPGRPPPGLPSTSLPYALTYSAPLPDNLCTP